MINVEQYIPEQDRLKILGERITFFISEIYQHQLNIMVAEKHNYPEHKKEAEDAIVFLTQAFETHKEEFDRLAKIVNDRVEAEKMNNEFSQIVENENLVIPGEIIESEVSE